MSVKDVQEMGIKWKESLTGEENQLFKLKNTPKDCYEDVNGYAYTQAIWGRGSATLTDKYPAFEAVKAFNNSNSQNESESLLKMTDWYLPAIGEWYDIIENLGDVCISSDLKTSTTEDSKAEFSERLYSDRIALYNINTHLKKLNCCDTLHDSYWSSSVRANTSALRIRFGSGDIQLKSESKNRENNIRCVRAFKYRSRRM